MKLSIEQTNQRIVHIAKVYFSVGKSNARTIEECGFSPKISLNTLCKYKNTILWKTTIKELEKEEILKNDISIDCFIYVFIYFLILYIYDSFIR